MSDPNPPLASRRMEAVRAASGAFWDFLVGQEYERRRAGPGVIDMSLGDPHEMPPAGFVDALKTWAEPKSVDWFAYKVSEPEARAAVARSLIAWRGLPFESEDIAMTTGAFGAIAVALSATVDPGDEVILNLPPWFNYEPMIVNLGAEPVKVRVREADFDLDLAAIDAAITPNTRMVIVNTPNNPTGRIYPPATLQGLADILTAASTRNGRTIYLLADEPYSRLIFEGKSFPSPSAYYANTMISYSYGKVLLTPGQRIGFLALAPDMPAREAMRESIVLAQLAGGFLFPNALLQHAIADLDKLSIDLSALQEKRDVLYAGLRSAGYEVHRPEATFYLLPKSPLPDDEAFCARLADRGLLVLPGRVRQAPGRFRITFTASMAMIEAALPILAKVMAEARREAS